MSIYGASRLAEDVFGSGNDIGIDLPGCARDAQILLFADRPDGHAIAPPPIAQILVPSAAQARTRLASLAAPEPAEDLDVDAAFYEVIRQASGQAPSEAVVQPVPLGADLEARSEAAIRDWLCAYVLQDPETDTGSGHAAEERHHGTSNAPCYMPGTLIMTLRGQIDIARLMPGEMILTRDHGFQAVRDVVHKTLRHAEIVAHPDLAPVLVKADALGPGRPAADMCVSSHHRVLLTGQHANLLAGEDAVLISVQSLIDGVHVLRMPAVEVTYMTLLFDAPEVIYANGSASESLGIDSVSQDVDAPHRAPDIRGAESLRAGVGARYLS